MGKRVTDKSAREKGGKETSNNAGGQFRNQSEGNAPTKGKGGRKSAPNPKSAHLAPPITSKRRSLPAEHTGARPAKKARTSHNFVESARRNTIIASGGESGLSSSDDDTSGDSQEETDQTDPSDQSTLRLTRGIADTTRTDDVLGQVKDGSSFAAARGDFELMKLFEGSVLSKYEEESSDLLASYNKFIRGGKAVLVDVLADQMMPSMLASVDKIDSTIESSIEVFSAGRTTFDQDVSANHAQLEQQIRHLRELTAKLEAVSAEADRDIETSHTLCVTTLKTLQVKYRKDRALLLQERHDITDTKKAAKALKTNLALMAAA